MGDDQQGSGDGGAKQIASGGLLRVVWFRQMLHRWQSSSSASASAADDDEGTSTQINSNADAADHAKKPLPRVVVVEERQHHRSGPDHHPPPPPSPVAPEDPPPADVPRGCCAVYVGAERRRFVVRTAYLADPVFARLLEKAEEEFGFDYRGDGITIPCDTEAFKYIVGVVEAHRQHARVDDDDEGNPKDREDAEASSSETR